MKTVKNSGYEITVKIENLLIYPIGVFYSDFPTVAVDEKNTPIKIDVAENKLRSIVLISALTHKNSHSAELFMLRTLKVLSQTEMAPRGLLRAELRLLWSEYVQVCTEIRLFRNE